MGELFAGRYELVDPLGEGGSGSVWRAWDHRAECFIAAKVLRQSDAVSLLRFVREQSLRIDHPHVVKPLGWAGEDERVLFTMPLIRGGSVAMLLGDFHTLPVPWAVLLLDQLLDALSAVHAAGVVHRDVKPANLLLEPTGPGRPLLRLVPPPGRVPDDGGQALRSSTTCPSCRRTGRGRPAAPQGRRPPWTVGRPHRTDGRFAPSPLHASGTPVDAGVDRGGQRWVAPVVAAG